MWVRTLAVAVVFWAGVCVGQSSVSGSDTAAELVVWRVVAVAPYRGGGQISTQVSTSTSGDFGQPAGGFGNTAANTGQTSGSFGQTASSTGTAASNTGQSVGSFGHSLSSLNDAAAKANGTRSRSRLDDDWERFASSVGSSFRNVSYEDVGENELAARLESVAGTAASPDVLVGAPLPFSWSREDTGLVRRFGLVTVGVAGLLPQTEAVESASLAFKPEASIVAGAPHPAAARQFVLWLYDREMCRNCDRDISLGGTQAEAAAVAKSALYGELVGTGVSGADPEMAKFDAAVAQAMALGVHDGGLLGGFRVRINVTGAQANARFAVVTMRAVVENAAAFGVTHAVAVLRTDVNGRWHVLQVTPNLQLDQQTVAWTILRGYGAVVRRETVAAVLGIAAAAPVDGDNRERSPELWWDNKGGATLEVVEWQRSAGESWTGSNMFLIPDSSGHLRTRVTGRFADAAGRYRWRIWSVGDSGAMVISPWRSFNVLAH